MRARGPRRRSTSTASPTENLHALAEAKGVYVEDLTVVVLDRPRHDELIEEVRRAGARIKLISDGDVSAALATTKPETGIDLLIGIGARAAGHPRRGGAHVPRRRDAGAAQAAQRVRSAAAAARSASSTSQRKYTLDELASRHRDRRRDRRDARATTWPACAT